jgi:hypothetical protein
VFIVVLVIAMLTAIGVFAASSASLSTSSAGHERLATQAQYLTEFGVQIALADLDKGGGWNRIDAARQSAERQGQPVTCFANTPDCWSMDRTQLEDIAGGPLLEPPDNPVGTPGSLGYAALDWDLRVELSDKRVVAVAGNSAVPDQKSPTTYCSVTVNARGAVWPMATANQDLVVASAGGQSFLSGAVLVLCPTN